MRKTIFILILFFLFTAAKVLATAQYPDKIVYNGKEYDLHTTPLKPFFEKNPDRKPTVEMMSTALWRGYIATFEIDENQLFLKDIQVMAYSANREDPPEKVHWKSVMEEVFPGKDRVKADWMTGLLVLPYGEIVNYVHMGYASTYSNYILLEISEGRLTKEINLDAKGYDDFRKRQFQAFKKTKEYKELKKELKKNHDESDQFFDTFLSEFVLDYTSKIFD